MRGLFKNNRDVDSTIAVIATFAGFLLLIVTVKVAVHRGMDIPEALLEVFRTVRELVLVILTYFFAKSQLNGNGNGHDEPEEVKKKEWRR